jgi:uncharacterized LabA/DUF88 family protein
MKPRHAVLLDGGFVLKRLRSRLGRPAEASDVLGECDRINRCAMLENSTLLRVLFYDAPPAVGVVTNPFDGRSLNLARTPQHARGLALHNALEQMPDMALRLGETVVRGWQIDAEHVGDLARSRRAVAEADARLDIQQKGVDLRIGLDIARLSLRQLVEVIVVVTADRDLVPAFRFARREGLRVYLDCLGAAFVHRDLIAHADRVL